MADLKISQLTGATTPLAGTEVLPIVQSGSTVKVSVANLTAGRAVAMSGGSFTDNITQSTAAKGVNFTANTPAAGMTSQLLNWYEEGTFTPTIADGATGVSYTTQSGHYTRLGNMVFFRLNLVMSAATANGSAFKVGGLPFTCGQSGGGSFAYDNGAWTGSASTNMPMVFVGAGGTEITFFQGSGAQVVGTDLVNIGTDNFYIVGQYMV